MQGFVYLCFVGLLSVAQCNRVVRFSYEEVDDDGRKPSVPLINLLQPLSRQDSKVRLGAFQWNDCQKPSKVLQLQSLAVSPDPIKAGANVDVTIKGILSETVSGPIQGAINLEIWTAGAWVRIPCVNGLGSCGFDDLCTLGSNICPLKKGSYDQTKSFPIPPFVPPGRFRITLNMNHQGSWLACVQVIVDVSR